MSSVANSPRNAQVRAEKIRAHSKNELTARKDLATMATGEIPIEAQGASHPVIQFAE